MCLDGLNSDHPRSVLLSAKLVICVAFMMGSMAIILSGVLLSFKLVIRAAFTDGVNSDHSRGCTVVVY